MKILKKNDEIILKRVEDYNKKQEKILERQKIHEIENKKKWNKSISNYAKKKNGV